MSSTSSNHKDATLLQVDHVTKVYHGGVRANDDISLSVNAGEVFGLLGQWQMLSRKSLLVLTLILETLVGVGFTITICLGCGRIRGNNAGREAALDNAKAID